MKRNPVLDEDRRSVADFFARWATLVGNVDFKRARELYTEDVIAFGSLGKMLPGATGHCVASYHSGNTQWASLEVNVTE